MIRTGGFALAVALAFCMLASRPSLSQTGPFAGTPSVDQAGSSSAGAGLFQPLLSRFIRLQRDVNRALSDSVVAIKEGRSLHALLIAAAIAFLYGAFHAAGPGHGKAVVVSYFLSREASVLRGIRMGSQIALFHVLSAIVIVLVLHWLLERSFARPVDQLQFLKVISYGAIAAIGLALLIGSIRRLRGRGTPDHSCHHHRGESHPAGSAGKGVSAVLSFAVGLIPCSGAVLILIYALANGLLLSGIVMTLFIAVGMAITLSAIGVGAILLRARTVGAASGPKRQRTAVAAVLEIAGPLFITAFSSLLFAASL